MEPLTSTLYIAFLGFLSGLILNFMPCVLPLVGIKLASFSRLKTSKEVKVLSGFTSLGIITFCMVIALIFTVFKNLYWGFQLQSPSFIAVLIFIFAIFTLVLSGKIDINPSFSVNSFKSHLLEGFASGFLIVTFSLSCVAPVVASAISLSFASQSSHTLFICLFFIGLGLSLPYILIGFFNFKIKVRPNSFLVLLAKGFSYVAVCATIAYLVFVLYSQVNLYIVLLVALLCIIGTLVIYKTKNVYIFLASIIIIFATPFIKLERQNEEAQLSSVPFSIARLNEYLNKGSTIVVSIEAAWCVTCKANDVNVFKSERFVNFIKENNIVFMKGDLTLKDPLIEGFMAQFDSYGVPFYAVFSPNNKEGKLLPIFFTTENLIEEIQSFN